MGLLPRRLARRSFSTRAVEAENSIYRALRSAATTLCTMTRSASYRSLSSRSMATTMRRLMMTTTMSSSRSEKPRSSRTAGASPRERSHVPHRQEYAQREYKDEDAHEHEKDGLDFRRQAFHLDGNLALVHVGDLGHELVDFAGFLAHRDHLQHDRIEDPRRHSGSEDALAPFDAVAHLQDARFQIRVVQDLGHDGEHLHDGYSALRRNREAAREPGERRLVDQFAYQGQAQLEPAPPIGPG